MRRQSHPGIVRSTHEESIADGDLPAAIDDLNALAASGDAPGIIRRLQEAIPGACDQRGACTGYHGYRLMPEVSLANWNEYLQDHPQSHFLQTGEWGELKGRYGWEAVRLVVGAQRRPSPLPPPSVGTATGVHTEG